MTDVSAQLHHVNLEWDVKGEKKTYSSLLWDRPFDIYFQPRFMSFSHLFCWFYISQPWKYHQPEFGVNEVGYVILFRAFSCLIWRSQYNFPQFFWNFACPWTLPSWSACASLELRVSNKELRTGCNKSFTILRSNVINPYQTYGSVCFQIVFEQLFRVIICLIFQEKMLYRHELKTISRRFLIQTANRKKSGSSMKPRCICTRNAWGILLLCQV